MTVSANVKIAMQCFENFGEGHLTPLVARLTYPTSFGGACSTNCII